MKNRFEDLQIANVGEKQGVFNAELQFVVQPIYDEVIIWSYGIEVVKDGKHGGYNFDGKLIVPVEYASVNFNEKYFVLVTNFEDLYGAYDYEGKLVIPVEYADITVYDRIAVVEDIDGYYGVYHEKGLLIIAQYSDIDVVEDLIIARMSELQEVYTLAGKKIVSVVCPFVDVHRGFIVAIYEDDDITVYNKEGKCLLSWDDSYGEFEANEHYFVVKVSDRYKVYDKEGRCFNEEGYEDVYVAEKFVNVLEDGHWKVLCECE